MGKTQSAPYPYPSSTTSPASTTRVWSAPESAKLGNVIAVAAADNRGDIETFGNAKIDWFETFLELPNGIPPRHLRARLLPHRRPKPPTSNGQSGSGKPPKGKSWQLTARPFGAPLTNRTANPPSTRRARGRPRMARRSGGRERDQCRTRGGEHVDAPAVGAESGERGEVSEIGVEAKLKRAG